MIKISYRKHIKSNIINIQEAYKLQIYKGAIIVDVRSRQEYYEGHISGSINIPLIDFEKYSIDRNKIIILYCNAGVRSRKAMMILKSKGYKDVYILEMKEIP